MDRTEVKDELKRIKKNIENAYQGFSENYETFTRWRNFIFVDTLSDGNKSVNNQIQRPNVQVNLLEAYLSRLCGEISKNEPCPTISSSDDFMPKNEQEAQLQVQQIEVLEGYARHLLQEANKNGLEFNLLRDTFSGGMTSLKLKTDYINPKSFVQDIKIERTYDQTLVGFDLLATKPDKSDGDFCFEIIPMRYEDFHREFKDVDLSDMKFVSGFLPMKSGQGHLGPFNWSYKVGDERIILVCDYYEKDRKKEKLFRLTDGKTLLGKSAVEEHLKQWEKGGEFYPDQAPEIADERMTETTQIVRHRLIQNKIIKTEKTDFYNLPIKFIDGNSIVTKDDRTGSCHQMTKPFFYQAEGAQRLKNFSIQCLCDELENMRPAQIIASLESIPEQYIDAYREPKNTTTLVYYQFKDGNPQVPLNPPQIAQRSPIPAEILEASAMADTLIQNILGASNVSNVPMTDAEMSGKAIQEVLSAGIASARPYIVNYLMGVQSGIQDIIDLMPKFQKTPRSLPIITRDGKRTAVLIGDGGTPMDYEPGAFNIKVEMGASFGVQQSKALQQVTALAHAIPEFGRFINDACLDLVTDSLEIRNKEEYQRRATMWLQEQQQMKQQAMAQAQNMPNIEEMAMQVAAEQVKAEHQVGMAKVQQSAQAEQMKSSLKMEELALKNRELEVEVAKIVAQMRIEEEKLGIEQQKADDERVTTVLEAAIKTSEHTHSLADKHFGREMSLQEANRAHELAERAEERVYEAETKKMTAKKPKTGKKKE